MNATDYAGFPASNPPAHKAPASLHSVAGLGREIEHNGKVLTLAPSDHLGVIARYGRHLRERALKEVDDARRFAGPGVGEAAMTAYLELSACGAFEFGSKLYAGSLASGSRENAVALVWAMLLVHRPGTSRSVAEELLTQKSEELDRLFSAEADGPPAPAPGSAN